MNRVRWFAAVAILLAGCASRPPLDAGRFDALLEDLHRRALFQGAVVAGREGSPPYARGFGYADVARAVPFTPDTRTDGGSIAKTFTAAALAVLADEGRIDLEAAVQRHVPSFLHASTRVRHLLSHAAGLPGYDWTDAQARPGEIRTNASNLDAIARAQRPPAFVPGTAFAYDNVAYDVAALVVESVSGMSYEAFLAARFWKPLGLTAFVRPARLADFPAPRTRGYARTAGGFRDNDAEDLEGFHGGGNVYLSAFDHFLWARGFDAVAGPRVAAESRRPATLDDGRATGLGKLNWYLSPDGERRYYLGHHNGFHGVAYSDRARGIAVSYVANDTPPAWLQPALARALVAIAEGREPEPLVAPDTSDALEPAEGSYPVEGVGEVRVRRDGRRLLVTIAAVEYRAFRADAHTHYVPGVDAYLRFRRDATAGAALEWDSILLRARAPRRPGTG